MKFARFTRIEQELKSCAFLILSFPRCGRTWMKHLLGYYIEKKYFHEKPPVFISGFQLHFLVSLYLHSIYLNQKFLGV